MIASLMMYCLSLAVLISLGAWALDRALTSHHLPRRGIWIAAMMASLWVPIVLMTTTDSPTTSVGIISEAAQVGIDQDIDQPIDRTATIANTHSNLRWLSVTEVRVSDSALKIMWMTTSLSILGFFLFWWMRLQRAKKHWSHEQIDGTTTYLSDDLGPAVLGFVKPMIVVPRWLLTAHKQTLAMVIAHERAHITARDPLLHLLALTLIVITPWNLPLWWQLRRLRFAIEVDCDARVLRREFDVSSYAEMLLSVGQHHSRTPMSAIALIKPTSQLEQRIQIMASESYRYAKLLSVGAIAMSVSMGVLAARIKAPVIPTKQVTAQPSATPVENHQTTRAIAPTATVTQTQITPTIKSTPATVAPIRNSTNTSPDNPALSTFASGQLKPISFGQPAFPTATINDNSEGWVEVGYTVGKAGTVEDAYVRDSNLSETDQQLALAAVRQWRYEPPTRDGKPTTIDMMTRMGFSPASRKDTSPPAALESEQIRASLPMLSTSQLKRTSVVWPEMPEAATQSGISGWVEVAFTVTEDGRVSDAKVRHATGDESFKEAALSAIRQWRYEAPMVDEKPAAVRTMIRLKFYPERSLDINQTSTNNLSLQRHPLIPSGLAW